MEPGLSTTTTFKKWRMRFSLRDLFVITTLAAIGAYWWSVLPTTLAKQFITAIQQEQYDAADRMFPTAEDRFLAELYKQANRFEVEALLEPKDQNNNWPSSRVIALRITYGTWNHASTYSVRIHVTRSGLGKPAYEFDVYSITIASIVH